MAPGGPYIGKVSILTNAPDGDREVTARVVVGPCEQGWCDSGWTCSAATHLCEPPQACAVSAECGAGDYCPPDVGYCQPSSTCVDDLACQGLGWQIAFACDLDRSTCDLASCDDDDACPQMAYCDEVGGWCIPSAACEFDQECVAWPFAQECDVPRQTCEPSECTDDSMCPSASYCSTFWEQCVVTSMCDTDLDCMGNGWQCDEDRNSCRP